MEDIPNTQTNNQRSQGSFGHLGITYHDDTDYIACADQVKSKLAAFPREMLDQILTPLDFIKQLSIITHDCQLLCFSATKFYQIDLRNKTFVKEQTIPPNMQRFIKRVQREGIYRTSIQGASKDHDTLIIRVLFIEYRGSNWRSRYRMHHEDNLTNSIFKYSIKDNTFISLLEDYDDKVLSQNNYGEYIYYASIDARRGVVWIEQVNIKHTSSRPTFHKFLACFPYRSSFRYRFIVDNESKLIYCLSWNELNNYYGPSKTSLD